MARQLALYGDGAIFTYALASDDAWAFHWHNVSGRLFTYLYADLPAQTYGVLTGDAHGAIALYGLAFFAAPLLGLGATFAADRSAGRVLFAFACASSALVCPLVFGFPTETWMTHALFWPTLALCHYARHGKAASALVLAALVALVFTHEGALILAVAILATLALRGMHDAAFRRGAWAFAAAVAAWIAVKAAIRPDAYFAGVFLTAALHVFDPEILQAPILVLLAATFAAYGILRLALHRLAPKAAPWLAAALVAAGLLIYWLRFDHALHAEDRYYMRSVLLIVTPALGLLAAALVLNAEGRLSAWPLLPRLFALLRTQSTVRTACGALVLVNLVHAVETAKFVGAWEGYLAAVRRLATGSVSDPALGDARFVSAARLPAALDRLAWFSTTPFLSVLVAPGFAPARLVVDPRANYFWLSCAVARANLSAAGGIPSESRKLIAMFSCLHRP